MARQMTPARAARIRSKFRDLEDTIQTVFWDVSWELWRRDRPSGWVSETTPERWVRIATGLGRLRENGSGGPVIGDGQIYQQAPYRLRVDESAFDAFRMPTAGKSEHDVSSAWLVIEGVRLFKVTAFAPRAGERQHANAYLSEVFDAELPVEAS